jgi:hypothetical protein
MAFAQAVSNMVKNALTVVENQFLETISKDYNLPIEELRTKYKVSAETTSLKRPYKRKATVEVVDQDGNKVEAKKAKESEERALCKGTTAKREPCKFHALKGADFCKRHQEAFELLEARRTGKQVPSSKNIGGIEPKHNHAPDIVMHDSCDLCQSHGPVLGGFKPQVVMERLNSIIQGAVERKPAPPPPAPKVTLEAEEFSESGVICLDGSDDEEGSPAADDEEEGAPAAYDEDAEAKALLALEEEPEDD